jgi:tetratricopeptide (TPR) repeat protein
LEGDGLDEAVAALRMFALIDRETIVDERERVIATNTIRLHRLVRQVAVARCGGEAGEKGRRRLIEALATVYPREVFSDPKSWPRARRLDVLVLVLVRRRCPAAWGGGGAGVWSTEFTRGIPASGARGYTLARPLYERALAIREKVLGPEHPNTATSLNYLGGLLKDQGDFAGARPLQERALAIREKVLGHEHPDTATSLNYLGGLLEALGDLNGARSYQERALAIREKVLGPEHPHTATTLNNLAFFLSARWRFARKCSA